MKGRKKYGKFMSGTEMVEVVKSIYNVCSMPTKDIVEFINSIQEHTINVVYDEENKIKYIDILYFDEKGFVKLKRFYKWCQNNYEVSCKNE